MEFKKWQQTEVSIFGNAIIDFLIKNKSKEKKQDNDAKFAHIKEVLSQKGYTRTMDEIKEQFTKVMNEKRAKSKGLVSETSSLSQKTDVKPLTCLQVENGNKNNLSSVGKILKRVNHLKKSGGITEKNIEQDKANKVITNNVELEKKTSNDYDHSVQNITSTEEIKNTSSNEEGLIHDNNTYKNDNASSSDTKDDIASDTRNTKKNISLEKNSKKANIQSVINCLTKENIQKSESTGSVNETSSWSQKTDVKPSTSLQVENGSKSALSSVCKIQKRDDHLKKSGSISKKKEQDKANNVIITNIVDLEKKASCDDDHSVQNISSTEEITNTTGCSNVNQTEPTQNEENPIHDNNTHKNENASSTDIKDDIASDTRNKKKNKALERNSKKANIGSVNNCLTKENIKKSVLKETLSTAPREREMHFFSKISPEKNNNAKSCKDIKLEIGKAETGPKNSPNKTLTFKDTSPVTNDCDQTLEAEGKSQSDANQTMVSKRKKRFSADENTVTVNHNADNKSKDCTINEGRATRSSNRNVKPITTSTPNTKVSTSRDDSLKTDNKMSQESKLPPKANQNKGSKHIKVPKICKKQKNTIKTAPKTFEESPGSKVEISEISENHQEREIENSKINEPKERTVIEVEGTFNINKTSSVNPLIELESRTKNITTDSLYSTNITTHLANTSEIPQNSEAVSNSTKRKSFCDEYFSLSENLDSGVKTRNKHSKICFCHEKACICNFSTQSSREIESVNPKSNKRKNEDVKHQSQLDQTSKNKTRVRVKTKPQGDPTRLPSAVIVPKAKSTVSPELVSTNDPVIPGIMDSSFPLPKPAKHDPNKKKQLTDLRRAYLKERRKRCAPLRKLKKVLKSELFWQNRNWSQNKNTIFYFSQSCQSWIPQEYKDIGKERLSNYPKLEYYVEPREHPRAQQRIQQKGIRVKDFAKKILGKETQSLEEEHQTMGNFSESGIEEPMVSNHSGPVKPDILPNDTDYYADDGTTNSATSKNTDGGDFCEYKVDLSKAPQSPPFCKVQVVQQLVDNSHPLVESSKLQSPASVVHSDVFLPVPEENSNKIPKEPGADVTSLYRNPSPPLSPSSVFPPSPASNLPGSSTLETETPPRWDLDTDVKSTRTKEKSSSEPEKLTKGDGLKKKHDCKTGGSTGPSKVLFSTVKRMEKRMQKMEKEVLSIRKSEKQRMKRDKKILESLSLLVAKSKTTST